MALYNICKLLGPKSCLTMKNNARLEGQSGGYFGVLIFDSQNNTLLEVASRFHSSGESFKKCFDGRAARLEFSTTNTNGWIGSLDLTNNGLQIAFRKIRYTAYPYPVPKKSVDDGYARDTLFFDNSKNFVKNGNFCRIPKLSLFVWDVKEKLEK